ncbi:MAG: site-2 protease family protein [Planctomycetota bacterium]|nr:site-2 protease family protein [Planctomycetota bacterium]
MFGSEDTREVTSQPFGAPRARRPLSVALGRWGGIAFHLHLLFGVFVIGTLIYAWRESQLDGRGGIIRLASVFLAILLGSALLHEWAHIRAVIRCGGFVDQLVLVPWGGLSHLSIPPHAPHSVLRVYLAGPLANGLACLICIPLVVWWDTYAVVPELLHPLAPASLFENGAGSTGWDRTVVVKLMFWVNWVLMLVNLVPVFPFDGDRITRALLMIWRPAASPAQVAMTMTWVTRFSALLLCVAAYWVHQEWNAIQAVWISLLFVGVLLLMRDRQQERQAMFDGLSASDGTKTAVFPPSEQVALGSGWEATAVGADADLFPDEQEQLERNQDPEDEERLDEILDRLHRSGKENISEDDRAFLERVSQRFRRRRDG